MRLTNLLQQVFARNTSSRRSAGGVVTRRRERALAHSQHQLECLEVRVVLTTVLINYSLDTNNFFDTSAKKELLQAAADSVANALADNLLGITPGPSGIGSDNTWSVIFGHPATGAEHSITDLTVAADTILVYAGGRELSGTTVGQGGPGGFSSFGTDEFNDNVAARGQSGALLAMETDFGVWGGTITFDTVNDWHFGLTTDGLDSAETDFFSVAQHEIGHLLGIGTANSWKNQITDGRFTGTASVASFEADVPLFSDGSHWAEDTMSNGQVAAMNASLLNGTRAQFTELDFAALSDIGWEVTPAVPQKDYGDAPDTSAGTATGNYETLLANGGPSHVLDTTQMTLFLGTRVDGEADATPSTRANGDDITTLPDDEDGLIEPAQDLLLTVGTTSVVRVRATNTTGTAATLYGWIDFNRDGVFDNATERTSVTVPTATSNGTFTLTFPTIPINTATGATYSRFRLSTDLAAANSTGEAADGEVEDYAATITRLSDSTANSMKNVKIASGTNGGPALARDDYFGSAVASLGDLDGDGVTDLAVGAPGDYTTGDRRGAVYVQFMNSNGTVKSSVKIASETNGGPALAFLDAFGSSVASVGDLDGDGVTDLAVGAVGNGRTDDRGGAVYVLLLNSNGTVKSSMKIASEMNGGPTLATYDRFGTSVASLGDVDGDGVTDLAVGARYDDTNGAYGVNSDRGAVYVLLLNSNGMVKSSVKIASSTNGGPTLADGDFFGRSVTSLGDLDGDGVTDLAVGATGDDTGGTSRGAVYVLLLNSNGTVKSNVKLANGTNGGPTLANGDRFGSSVASMGDLDGDGMTDLAVGADGDATGGTRRGAVYLQYMNPNGTVKGSVKLASGTNGGPTLADVDRFGSSVTSLGDLDGDGVTDLAIGATNDDTGGVNSDRGAVHVLFLKRFNRPPTVEDVIPDQNATEESAFTFAFPVNTFADVDFGDSLAYSVTRSNGTALPNWLTFTAATRAFSGTPLNADIGTVSIKVTATDTENATVIDTFDIVVANTNDAPTLANAIADRNATEDSAFTFTIAANTFADVDVGDSLTYSATKSDVSALPSWLTFTAATRTFSGTPLNADVGTLSIKVTATDGSNAIAIDTFDIVVVNANDAPTLANAIPDQTASEDSTFTFAFAANTFADVDVSDSLTYSATRSNGAALPSWLTFTAATRTFSGTPLNANVGTLSIKVTSKDRSNASISDTFDIVVANTNDAPTLANAIPDRNATEESAFTFAFAANTFADVDAGDSLTYSATKSDGTALPSWLTFTATTRTFSGTPLNSDVGTLSIKVTATDTSNATATDTFNIVVAKSASVFNGGYTGSYSGTITDPRTISLASIIANRSFTATISDGDVTGYLPATGGTGTGNVDGEGNLEISDSGPILFRGEELFVTIVFYGRLVAGAAGVTGSGTIDISGDVSGTGTWTATRTSTTPNKAPVFEIPTPEQLVLEDAGVRIVNGFATGITDGDIDKIQTSNFLVTTNNDSLFVTKPAINATTGILTYTPAPNANGTATVTVKLKDNGGTARGGVDTSASKTFLITVTPVNDGPTITAIKDVTIDEDKATSAIAFKVDDPEDKLVNLNVVTITATSSNTDLVPNLPANIVFGGSVGSRTIKLVPLANQFGMTTITVTATDSSGATTEETFVLTVRPINDAPRVVPATFQLLEFTANNASVGTVAVVDPEGHAISSFAITGGNVGNAFKIDPVTGEIKVHDATKIDFEALARYVLAIKATDALGAIGSKATETGPITIDVQNLSFDPIVTALDTDNTVTVSKIGNNLVVRYGGVDVIPPTSLEDVASLTITGGIAKDTVLLDASLNSAGSPATKKFTGQIIVNGNAGDDTLDASKITVATFGITFNGGLDNDSALGGSGNDVLNGGDGNDTIKGGAGKDTIDGGDGNDKLRGGDGDDSVLGGLGTDLLSGDAGLDILNGNDGNDSILGGTGNDQLFGGIGNDQLFGQDGNDVLNGGADADSLSGGAGINTTPDFAAGLDTIGAFSAELTALLAALP